MSDEVDRAPVRVLGPGAFFHMPAGSVHASWAEQAGTTMDVFATGPFGINYQHPQPTAR